MLNLMKDIFSKISDYFAITNELNCTDYPKCPAKNEASSTTNSLSTTSSILISTLNDPPDNSCGLIVFFF